MAVLCCLLALPFSSSKSCCGHPASCALYLLFVVLYFSVSLASGKPACTLPVCLFCLPLLSYCLTWEDICLSKHSSSASGMSIFCWRGGIEILRLAGCGLCGGALYCAAAACLLPPAVAEGWEVYRAPSRNHQLTLEWFYPSVEREKREI